MNREPRVAVICDYSLGYLGGAQTALLQEAAALAAAEAYALVVSPSATEAWQRVRPTEAVQHEQLPSRLTLPGLDLPVIGNTARVRARLAEILTRHRIQVVQVQSEFGLAAAAITVAAELGLPVVHTVHTFFWRAPAAAQPLAPAIRGFHRMITGLPPTKIKLSERSADSALRNLTLSAARRAQLVLSPSAHQATRLRRAGLENVAVLPNTVCDPPDASPVTRVDGPLKIIWIGRCAPEKRILPFVRAVGLARDRLGPGKLEVTIVGDGPQLAEARTIGAGITFLGRQDHDQIAGLLAESQLAALTSYGFDNQPMTVVEAVMALRGVLYCDPALAEGLEGPGILSPADETGMAQLIIELVHDPGRVVAASAAAVTARTAFSPTHHAEELIKHYRRLIKEFD